VPGRASNPTHWSRDGDAGVDPVRTGVVAGTVSVSNQGVSVARRFAGAGVDLRVVEGLGGLGGSRTSQDGAKDHDRGGAHEVSGTPLKEGQKVSRRS